MLQKPDTNKPFFLMNKEAKNWAELNRCSFCGLPIIETDYRDDLSKQEYSISGMCQHCQDKTFGKDREDDMHDESDDKPDGWTTITT